VIDIRVSPGQGSTGTAPPTSETPPTPEEIRARVSTLVSVAQDHFLKGEFDLAASAYEQALRAGASPGSTNQRLGQCYTKLGRKQDAIQAYERAVAAYRAQKASGTGDAELLENSAAVCEQAIKVLRGG
jgi:tetratricopeptide (TPR) repeat protein